MNSKQVMNHAADNIRILAASMVEKAKSGHPGGAMGGADFINVFRRIIQIGDDFRLIRNGKDETVSSSTPVTWLPCSIPNWHLSVSSHWTS